ncbi:hypothetical protein ACFSBZ_12265 [Amnibacterium flavum]|uniref:Cation-transporting ATPase n=1 Tax=Amnibacterium flavum TaxID=2173173 RepID=A0A2V1HTB0_9MICO|nr:hypothetical protein [Amnibacterium flavum]PVZ95571.1 hypothetical protein DDQ50_03470 [Amnibacterium flavum]
MSMFSKLTGMAQKALDKSGSSQQGSGSGDWRSMVRSAADALTGDGRPTRSTRPAADTAYRAPAVPARTGAAAPVDPADRAAIARYDYLLQTADPHQLETVHREAFARLTPAQREQIQARMNEELPAHERPRSAGTDDLARAATRTEMGRPGMLRGLLARAGGSRSGGGIGRTAMVGGAAAGAGLAAGGVLGAVAGGAILSSIAGPLLADAANFGVDFDALAGNLDIEGLTGGLDGVADGAGEAVSGLGDQVSGFGDQLGGLGSDFQIPGLDDFFGR